MNNTTVFIPLDKSSQKQDQKHKTIISDDTTVISQKDKTNKKSQMKNNLAKHVDYVPKFKHRQTIWLNEKKPTFSFIHPL